MIKFTIRRLTEEEIFDYLSDIDQSLVPPLSARVNIKNYSKKLHQNAVHFCALDNNYLIGIALCYLNDPAGENCYISSFSVSELYRNQGIASKLLKSVMENAKGKGFKTVSLMVFRDNHSAIILYKKLGFLSERHDGEKDFIMMKNILKQV